jgi:RHS repeat-associated protein
MTHIGFTGKWHDDELQLDYFGARYYDASMGRFVSIDPAAFSQGNLHSFNRYAYANNNPYRFIDPDGREAACITAGTSCVNEAGVVRGLQSLWGSPFTGMAIPAVGAAQGMADAYNEPSAFNIAMAVVGFVPELGPMLRGVKSEARVLKDIGEVKNTEKVISSEGVISIPDFQNVKQVGEIKDAKRVSDTAQLRAQREYAEATGREHVVITGAETQVSKTVESGSTVIRRDDLGPSP